MEKYKRHSIKANLIQYKWLYLVGIMALVAVDISQLQIPVITGNITDGLQASSMSTSLLYRSLIRLLIYGALISFGRFMWRMFIFGTSRKIERNLRREYFIKLEALSSNFYNENKTGDLMAYATNDLNAIRMMVGPGVLMALDAVILTVFVTIKMVTTISPSLTLVSISPLPIIALGSLLLGVVIRRRFKEKQEAFAHLSDLVQENISGMRVIKAFVKEAYEMTKFSVANRNNYDKNMNVVKLFAIIMPLVVLISGLSIAIALGYGGKMTMIGQISLGQFVTFIQYIMMLIWPMMAFGWCINIMSQGMASLTRYNEIMDTPLQVKDGEDLLEVRALDGNIEFRNLTFAYGLEDEPVLKGLSFTIKKRGGDGWYPW